MSQFWHANWAEDTFKPIVLGNWEVPRWHPKWPCCRHSTTTKFVADNSGRLLPNQPRPKSSPWGNYKGTWELPNRIDRNLAEKLSGPSKREIAAWEAHKKLYEGKGDSKATGKRNNIDKKAKRKTTAKEEEPDKIQEERGKPVVMERRENNEETEEN